MCTTEHTARPETPILQRCSSLSAPTTSRTVPNREAPNPSGPKGLGPRIVYVPGGAHTSPTKDKDPKISQG